MVQKIADAQSKIDGLVVAEMIIEFVREFRDVYGADTMGSSLCAVGPLQAMLGNAIQKGIISLSRHPERNDNAE